MGRIQTYTDMMEEMACRVESRRSNRRNALGMEDLSVSSCGLAEGDLGEPTPHRGLRPHYSGDPGGDEEEQSPCNDLRESFEQLDEHSDGKEMSGGSGRTQETAGRREQGTQMTVLSEIILPSSVRSKKTSTSMSRPSSPSSRPARYRQGLRRSYGLRCSIWWRSGRFRTATSRHSARTRVFRWTSR